MLRAYGSTDATVGGGKVRKPGGGRGNGNGKGKGGGGGGGGYADAVVADGAAVYMRFGESSGSSAANSGSLGTSGVYQSGTTVGVAGLLASDPTNNACEFNGTNGFVSIGSNSFANYTTEFTLEAIIRPTRVTNEVIISHSTGGYMLRVFNGTLNFVRSFQADIGSTGAGTIAANTTYHVACTFSSGSWVLYINGSSAASGSGATIGGGASGIEIGTDNGAAPFQGKLDEVAVYPTALTGTQIANHNSLR